MNRDSDLHDDMRSEYDFRGGVRGKYFQLYNAGRITIESDLVASATSTSESVGAITRPLAMTRPVLYAYNVPSPKIRGGHAVTVDAG